MPLVARGYEVHAVSSRPAAPSDDAVRWQQIDLLDVASMSRMIKTVAPTHLLHLAWYAAPGKYWTSSLNCDWLGASLALLRAFHDAGGQRVVIAGSCAEYDWRYGFCSELITPTAPATLYGTAKNALREMLAAYAREAALSSAWGRLFFLYGPHEYPSRLVPSVVTTLLSGGIARCTHGEQLRDFLHVEDAASAFVTLLDSDVQGPVNIASGAPIAVRDVVLTAARYLDAVDRVQLGAIPLAAGEPSLLVGDTRRLRDELEWVPSRTLCAGIHETVDWWREHQSGVDAS
jgi:nucleoside-diphosphate-sugar epimerase